MTESPKQRQDANKTWTQALVLVEYNLELFVAHVVELLERPEYS